MAKDSRAKPESAIGDVVTVTAEAVGNLLRGSGFERRCTIGGLILGNLFLGSRLAWRARSSSGHVSFRTLSGLLRGRISKSELHRSVTTYLVCQDLEFVSSSQYLTVSHVDVVEALPRQWQAELLREAETQRWSVRQLAQAKMRLACVAASRGRRGRPARSLAKRIAARGGAVAKILQAMERELSAEHGAGDPDEGRQLEACLAAIEVCHAALAGAVLRWRQRGGPSLCQKSVA
jgi:hypothetical protein